MRNPDYEEAHENPIDGPPEPYHNPKTDYPKGQWAPESDDEGIFRMSDDGDEEEGENGEDEED
jgi:hypothetical protein